MAHQVYWLKENSILSVDYTGHVTPEDMEEATTIALSIVREHKIYCIVDLSKMSSNPPNMLRSANKMKPFLELSRHPNVVWFAIIGPSSMAKFAIQLFFRSGNYRIFADRAEAENYLIELSEEESHEN